MAPNSLKKLRRNPSQQRSKFLVDSVLTAARQLLSRANASRFSTVRIAQLAGVGVGSLYEYFENKQAVLQSVLKNEIDKNISALVDSLPAVQNSRTPIDLGPLIEKMMEHFSEIRTLTEHLFMALPREVTTPLIMKARTQAADLILEKYQLHPEMRTEIVFLVNLFMDSIHSMRWHEQAGQEYLSRPEMVGYLKRISHSVLAARVPS